MAEALDTYSDLDLSDVEDDNDLSELSKKFRAAADYMKNLVGRLNPEKLLQIYSYYKQGNEGPCNIPRPKWYEIQAKQKWDAWNSLGDISPEVAKEKYIKIISELEPNWDKDIKDKDSSKAKKNSNNWVTVSSLCNNETDELSSGAKTIFDFCKENNVWQVQSILNTEPSLLNSLDEQGLGLLHWAADRGYIDMIKMLIQANCQLDLKDETGQTALHYAASCGHKECVKMLLDIGIDKLVKDEDGCTAVDITSDEHIKKMLA